MIMVLSGMILVGITIANAQAADKAPIVELTQSVRHATSVAQFRKVYPCPGTGKTTGACVGWVVDHGIPLCAGGADKPYNMHWQLKADSYLKDADERHLCALVKLRKAA